MLKQIESIYYKILYSSFTTNYESVNTLDVLLIYLENSGIKEYKKKDNFNGIIIFNDNTEFNFWNTNRWYAWMHQGKIKFSNGQEYSWYQKMPNFKVLYFFKKEIVRLEKNEIRKLKEEENLKAKQMMNNAPISYIRKQKLKKIRKRKLF